MHDYKFSKSVYDVAPVFQWRLIALLPSPLVENKTGKP